MAQPGQKIAVIGATGAGKSTLANLLMRFYDPTSGAVLLDGIDIRSITLESLRRQFALVPQEPLLFAISVRNNIAYGRPEASMRRIVEAATSANAHEFIMRLPYGYDTVLGERGGSLSIGQRQRIAIARAILQDAPILILDEPTSALDSRTEHEVMKALGHLMKGRTTFIIAHRLSTARSADRILVIGDGRLREIGTHAELMARGGTYAELVRLQNGGDIELPSPVEMEMLQPLQSTAEQKGQTGFRWVLAQPGSNGSRVYSTEQIAALIKDVRGDGARNHHAQRR